MSNGFFNILKRSVETETKAYRGFDLIKPDASCP
jgi:hypothetical protein